MPDIQKVLFLCIVAHNRGKVKYLISINSLKFVSGDVTPKFRSLKHKIIQQSLENAGNFLSIFCILCMALYGFV